MLKEKMTHQSEKPPEKIRHTKAEKHKEIQKLGDALETAQNIFTELIVKMRLEISAKHTFAERYAQCLFALKKLDNLLRHMATDNQLQPIQLKSIQAMTEQLYRAMESFGNHELSITTAVSTLRTLLVVGDLYNSMQMYTDPNMHGWHTGIQGTHEGKKLQNTINEKSDPELRAAEMRNDKSADEFNARNSPTMADRVRKALEPEGSPFKAHYKAARAAGYKGSSYNEADRREVITNLEELKRLIQFIPHESRDLIEEIIKLPMAQAAALLERRINELKEVQKLNISNRPLVARLLNKKTPEILQTASLLKQYIEVFKKVIFFVQNSPLGKNIPPISTYIAAVKKRDGLL